MNLAERIEAYLNCGPSDNVPLGGCRSLLREASQSINATTLLLEAVGRSACLDQKVSNECICFSCEANRILSGQSAVWT